MNVNSQRLTIRTPLNNRSISQQQQPKSILVKDRNRDKSPRLVHSNDANSVSIYAQSATDLSDDEEQGQPPHARTTPRGMLEVPGSSRGGDGGIRKSNSFTSNLAMDQEKKDTVMAFFGGTRWVDVYSILFNMNNANGVTYLP